MSSLAVQPDGKVIVGGTFGLTHATNSNVARLHPDGRFDTTFLANGAGSSVITAAAATCNASAAAAVSNYFAKADPAALNGTGTRYFGTDTRGTIFQDTAATLAEPLATAGTVKPVQ